ncbi:MAG: putative Ig domain-containing protein [Deltaproteobacteria bacterium]|nr:putative Ig domain-containing protein [Deltaproteobacteria bacterium]
MLTSRTAALGFWALSTLLAGEAAAQSYTVTTQSMSFSSIAGVGVPLSFSSVDDGTASVSLPFEFPFFGQRYPAGTTIYVSTNGLITFGASSTSYSNTAIPSSATPNAFIAGFWHDLEVGAGAVYTLSNASVLAIEWSNVNVLNTSAEYLSFRVELTPSGAIFIAHGPRGTGTTPRATVGVEDEYGTSGASAPCSPSCSVGGIYDGTVYELQPSSSPPPLGVDLRIASHTGGPPAGSVSPGATFIVDVNVANDGPQSAGSSYVGVFASTDPAVDSSDLLMTEGYVSSIAAYGSATSSLYVEVPAATPNGTYYVAAIADYAREVTESNEANNVYPLGTFTVGPSAGQITISTTSLPAAGVGVSYSFQLIATGAPSPTWQIIAGSLPSGLTLSTNGNITGMTSAQGTYAFTVEASQSGYGASQRSLVLEVNAGGGLSLATTTLPPATVGAAYSATMQAQGGAPPYGLQIIGGAPSWLTMSSDGRMSGTPTEAGHYELRVSIFDSGSNFAEGVATLDAVEAGPLTFVTTSAELPEAVTGASYDFQIVARGGVQPYQFSVSSGSLPAGINLSAQGRLTGIPEQVGRATFGVSVVDQEGGTVGGTLELNVSARAPLEITLPERITVRHDAETDFALTAQGGVPPYTWSITSGALLPGLTLDGDHLRGTPTSSTAPEAQVVFAVVDQEGERAERQVIVQISAGGSGARGGGATNRRDGGCGCSAAAPGTDPAPAWLLGVLVGLIGLRASLGRRSVVLRRRWRSSRTRPSHGARRSSRR